MKDLNKIKEGHTKVRVLKHLQLETQDYFKPSIENVTKDEIQYIFKIRSKTLNVKMNKKGQFESFECEVCNKEDETQEHIYQCKEIRKHIEKKESKVPDYENILIGDTKAKIEVARYMNRNLRIYSDVVNRR